MQTAYSSFNTLDRLGNGKKWVLSMACDYPFKAYKLAIIQCIEKMTEPSSPTSNPNRNHISTHVGESANMRSRNLPHNFRECPLR